MAYRFLYDKAIVFYNQSLQYFPTRNVNRWWFYCACERSSTLEPVIVTAGLMGLASITY